MGLYYLCSCFYLCYMILLIIKGVEGERMVNEKFLYEIINNEKLKL